MELTKPLNDIFFPLWYDVEDGIRFSDGPTTDFDRRMRIGRSSRFEGVEGGASDTVLSCWKLEFEFGVVEAFMLC